MYVRLCSYLCYVYVFVVYCVCRAKYVTILQSNTRIFQPQAKMARMSFIFIHWHEHAVYATHQHNKLYLHDEKNIHSSLVSRNTILSIYIQLLLNIGKKILKTMNDIYSYT